MDDEILEKARKGDYQYFVERVHEVAQTKHLVDEDGRSLLHNAITSCNAELVEFLIKNGAENCINSKDEEDWSPLHSAVSLGLDRITEILLLHGTEVNSRTSSGRTPLHYAASKGRESLLRILWTHGATMEARDEVGWTPLHRAASSGHLRIVKVLIDEVKVDPNLKDKTKQTPLSVALENKNDSISLFLVSRGANLESDVEIPEKLLQAMEDAREGRLDVDDL